MTTTSTELSNAQAALEAAQRKAAEAAERAEQAAAAHTAQREQRLTELAQTILDDYDETALDLAVKEARDRLRTAVLADPVWSAAVDLWAAQSRKYHRTIEAAAAATRLGNPTPPTAHPPTGLRIEDVLAIVGREAEARTADEQDARDTAAQAYADTGKH